jgi:hypothetical protein
VGDDRLGQDAGRKASPSSTTTTCQTTREGDVHVMDAYKAVWFKDPDGNILNLFNIAM